MTSQREAVRNIRAEWLEETGHDPGKVGAEVILDNLAEAFLHKWEGAGPKYAVEADPGTARYLAHRWTGEDGKRLRAAIAEADERYRVRQA
jgi:hypothetical protein